MMKSFSTLILAAVCCVFLFTNCKDDKEGANDKLTPTEHKQKLEEIGLKLIGKIDPNDHKELIQTLDTFRDLADEGDLNIETADFAGDFVKTVGAVISKNDLGAFVSSNAINSGVYQAKDYYGIYTYNESKEEWDYKESTSELTFNFKADGKDAVITLKASGTEVDVEIDGETIKVPPTAEGVIKRDSKELCKVTMKNTITKSSSYTVDLEAEMKVSGDYVFFVKTNMNEKEAKADFSLKKSGESLVSGNCKVNGQSMTNVDVIEDTKDLEDLFEKAEAYVQIMDDMNVKANCSNIKSMVKELNEVDYDDYDDEKKYCEAEAAILNKYTNAEMRYNDSNTVIATIDFQPYVSYEWTSNGQKYQDWDIEPVLVFNIDESRHTFVDYFGKNSFSRLINAAEKLAKDYEKFLN